MKNLSSLRMYLVAFFAFPLSLLTACGGSDSEAPTDTTPPTITYTELPTFKSVDEGDTVTLSLNTSGDGAKDINFIWQVSDDIDFTGQGSDSITFIAPEIDIFTAISVQVDVDSSTSKTFGFSREFTTVNVSNIESIHENKAISSNISLPTVTALNFEAITEGSIWYSEFESSIINTDNSGVVSINSKKQNILTIKTTNASTNEMTISQCGNNDDQVINLASFESNFGCDDANSSLNIQQNEDTFRFERMCGNEIVATNLYSKKSNDGQRYNAELNISFDSYDDLETTSQACGIVITAEVKSYDTSDTLVEQSTASSIYLVTEYQGNPLTLSFLIDELPTSLFASLSSGIFNDNFASVSTSVLPEVSNRGESNFGTIGFGFDNTMQNIQADYNFSVTSSVGQNEYIEGEFTLTFD